MAGEGSSQRASYKGEPRYRADGALLCHAHNKSGGMCGRPAMKNQKVCRYHGGASPLAVRAAERRVLVAEIEEQARKEQVLGPQERYKSPQDAIAGLYRVADRAEWMLDFLTKKIQAMNEIRWRSDSEQLRAEADLWDRTLAKQTTTLSSIIKLALNERQIALDEHIGRMVVKAITGSLRAAGLEGLELERAQREAHRLLRLEIAQEEPQALPPGTP